MFPIIPANSVTAASGNQEGIFGFGYTDAYLSMTNLVSNTGVVGTDVTGVGLIRNYPAACEYGEDKGIFGFGTVAGGRTGVTNLVSNTGVVASDTAGVGTGRGGLGACSFN